MKTKIIKYLFLILLIAAVATVAALATTPAYSAPPVSKDNLSEDERYMALAFAEIGKILPGEGYPVGAIVVRNGEIIGRAANQLFVSNNPTQHAEYIAVDEAIEAVKAKYPNEKYSDFFRDATVYVTLEPCPMDAGKITMLRFKKVSFCDLDEDWGALGSVDHFEGYPDEVEVEESTLPLCQKLRQEPGWLKDELWQLGRQYAAGTEQVPSLLSYYLKKVRLKWSL